MANARRNIISNVIGNVWMVLLTAIIVPLQINYLGMEAFGLIGLIATFQLIFNILDLGLSTTITRAVASDHSLEKHESKGIVNTAMVFYWFMAIVIAVFISFNADLIVRNILSESSLSHNIVVKGIFIIGFSVAARWPVALYMGILSGMQRQDILNFVKVICISLRLVGGIIVIIMTGEVVMFLYWILFSAIFEVAYYYYVCKIRAPDNYFKFTIDLASIKNVWKYSIAMNVIAVLSMILINIDKIFVSKLLSLEVLGYYYLAYNVAVSLTLIQISINNAMYPSFSEDFSRNRHENIINKYVNITQLTIYISALLAFVMIFYGHEGLVLWVGEDAASGSSSTMAILALGFLLTATVSNSYVASIAIGKPYITVVINIVATIIYIPLIYILISRHGIIGAAYSWLILNMYYLFVQVPIIYKLVLKIKYFDWFLKSLAPYLILGVICIGGSKSVLDAIDASGEIIIVFLLLISGIIVYLITGYNLLSNYIKNEIQQLLGKMHISFLKP